jgi:integrase
VATVAEVYAIAGKTRPWYRALVLMAAFTSLRWGELIALRRRDLDLDAGFVTVRSAVVEIDSKLDGGRPKSLAGVREVGLPETLLPELREHVRGGRSRGRMAGCSRGRTVRRRDAATSTGCGSRRRRTLPRVGVHLHDLRHTGTNLTRGPASRT